MDYQAKNKGFFSILVIFTIFTICAQSFGIEIFGTRESLETQEILNGGSGRPGNRRPSASVGQKAQMEVMTVFNNAYTKMVATVNANQVLSKAQIESNIATLRMSRKALPGLDKRTQAKYYILKAWNSYFDDDIKNAQEDAHTAYTKSPDFEDARVTKVSLALLAGDKPVTIPKKLAAATNVNPYNPYGSSSQGATSLDLDVDRLNTRLIDPKSPGTIGEMELNCLNSTTFKYTPGTEALCVIFWRLSDEEAAAAAASNEPNSPSSAASRPSAAPTPTTAPDYAGYESEFGPQPNMNPYGGAGQKQKDNLLTNTEAFKDMFARAFDTDNVKFLAVNIDKPAAKRMVVEKIMKNAWPWAHVMAHDPKIGDTQFKQVIDKQPIVKPDKPILMIISNEGTIKYAGPACGFLAPIMLSKVTGEKMNPDAVTANATASTKDPSNGKTGVASALMGIFSKPRTGSNNAAGTNATGSSNTKTATNRVNPQPKEMDSIEEAMAEKDLRDAKNLMGFSRGFTRRVINPKMGIEKCRDILDDYPNTKYSEEARVLLRGLSERDRKRYKVTNEEMGL